MTSGSVIGGEHSTTVAVPPERVWAVVTSVGGTTGWFTPEVVWTARCGVDRLLGGPGRRRLRPTGPLRVGDRVDFWTVEELDPGQRLLLRADTRLPGTATLELLVAPVDAGGARFTLRHGFAPDGPAGRAYGWSTRLGDLALFALMHHEMAAAALEAHDAPSGEA